jgi:hypothetical protein
MIIVQSTMHNTQTPCGPNVTLTPWESCPLQYGSK